MYDVATSAGVSQSLVSIAYRGAPGVSEETRERIFAAGRRLGFRPNANAARLASRTARTLGLFLLDLRNPFTSDVFDGVREVLQDRDVPLILAVGDPARHDDRVHIEDLLGARADVVIAAQTTLADDEVLELLGVERVVSVGRAIVGVDSVLTDESSAATDVAAHLGGLGHRRAAYLGASNPDDADPRREAFRRAARDAGIEIEVVADVVDAVGRVRSGEGAPTAVFAHNDLAAIRLVDALAGVGVHVPEGCSVVGFDDTPLASVRAVSLTSVDQHARELGRRAALLALERLDDPLRPPETVLVEPDLIVRSSTAPYLS
jgi:DNA-binding LacI/PurR family transcriptional regulator